MPVLTAIICVVNTIVSTAIICTVH